MCTYSTAEAAIAALYLRGAPRSFDVKRAGWMAVEGSLRVRAPSLVEAPDALRLDGLWAEALALESSGLLDWAEDVVRAGRVFGVGDDGYPRRWMDRLGACAPPALWRRGEVPAGPYLAVVGARQISSRERRFAEGCAAEAVRLGYCVVSGRAVGADRAAARGALRAGGGLLEIVPYGLERGVFERGGAVLSACAPDEEFSTGAAMERNALLYALGDAALIVRAQFKTGGTWHGAIDAHRRRLTRLIVREDPSNPAHRALVALGAVPLSRPEELALALRAGPMQGELVG